MSNPMTMADAFKIHDEALTHLKDIQQEMSRFARGKAYVDMTRDEKLRYDELRALFYSANAICTRIDNDINKAIAQLLKENEKDGV